MSGHHPDCPALYFTNRPERCRCAFLAMLDRPGLEAGMSEHTEHAEVDIEGVLAGHVALGDEDDGITQCSCGVIAIWRRDSADDEDSVRYLDTHAEGPDLRWHITHVAAVLREHIAAWMAPVCALADQWNDTLDYTPSVYDQGRVDQRHDMTAQLLEALDALGPVCPGNERRTT